MPDTPTLGEKLRRIRLERGLTQDQLAGGEYTKGFVSAVERGESGISDEALELFARRLGVPVAYFRMDRTSFELVLAEVQWALADGRAQEALEKLRGLMDAGTLHKVQTAVVHHWMGVTLLRLQRTGEAMDWLTRAHNMLEGLGERELLERTRDAIGVGYYQRGDPAEALRYHRRALEAFEAGTVKDPVFGAELHTNLANAHLALGNQEEALGHYREALRLLEPTQDMRRLAEVHRALSGACKDRGELEAALHHAHQALALYEMLGGRRQVGLLELSIGTVYAQMGLWEDALASYQKALAIAEDISDQETRAAALANLVDHHLATGDLDAARQRLEEALAAASAAGQPMVQGNALLRAALAWEALGDDDRADEYFQRAIQVFEQYALWARHTDACFYYAEFLEKRGQHGLATEYYRRAYLAVRARGGGARG